MPLGIHQVSYPLSNKGFLFVEKYLQREVNNSHVSSAEDKNVQNFTSFSQHIL
jgi:hypothetical protein